jgi:hypothetical protein
MMPNYGIFIFNIESSPDDKTHGTIMHMLNGSVLWMASLIGLLTAVKRYPDTR